MVTSLSYWFLNITRLTKNSARTNKVERESTQIILNCCKCFQEWRLKLSEHFGNIIFKKQLQLTKPPSSLNICFRIAKVFICASHCVPAVRFGLKAVLSKAADSRRPPQRALRRKTIAPLNFARFFLDNSKKCQTEVRM